MRWRIRVSTHHVHRPAGALLGLAVAIALLQMSAGVGLAYVSGFSRMDHVLSRVQRYWLVVMVAALCLSLLGYHFACRGAYERAGGPHLRPDQMRSVTVAGFGGLAASACRLQPAVGRPTGPGFPPRILAGGPLRVPLQKRRPGLAPPRRGPDRHREPGQGHLSEGARPTSGHWGMAVFWAAEIFAVWAGMAAFGFYMRPAPVVLGVGTGMIFTRRTAPLTGAGVIILTLVASLYYSAAPFAVALAGVFAYRVLSVWLPMPLAVAQLPRLRQMSRSGVPAAPHPASAPKEPALPSQAG